MKLIILFVSIALASGLLLTNLYTSLIDAKSWGSDIPNSINAARTYFKVTNPGNFFRLFSPVNQVLALLVLILFWKTSSSLRLYMGGALILYILTDVLTFAYFYPRNAILFEKPELPDTDTLKTIWKQWTNMNWIRSLILLTGIILSSISLHKIYSAR